MDMKETMELSGAVKAFTNELKEKSEDHKLSIGELVGLTDNVAEVASEAKDHAIIRQELKDLDREESKAFTDDLIDIFWDVVETIQNKPSFSL